MKKKKILEMYYDFMENGIPGDNGLCQHFEDDYQDWSLIIPSDEEEQELSKLGLDAVWWGNDTGTWVNRSVMTPLRENIVLLMAAINGEL